MKQPQPLVLDSIFYSVPALKILSGAYLEIHPGKISALIGLNGSGKSTLLKIAAGQIKASSGITKINGERFYSKSLKKRFQSIGYLPQESMLPGDVKVTNLTDCFPPENSVRNDSFFKKLMNQKVKTLSGGERRFLEISLLFSLNRDYFLLDEPFSGVEPYIIERIIDRIRTETQRKRGVLLTDHMHRYVSDVADDGYLLHNRQCYKLGNDVAGELKKMGYLR